MPETDAHANDGVRRLLRIARTVSDLPRALAFYRDALGFAAVGEIVDRDLAMARFPGDAARMQSVRMRLGGQEIELLAFDPPGQPYPRDSTAADLWFQHIAVVASDIDAAYQRVQGHGSGAITDGGPQRLPAAAGGVSAFKFRDPDGHPVELIQFPPGVGAPQWHAGASHVTMGYDHSAICVSDVERSVAFYTQLLGLHEASRQRNRSIEQDRLDGIHDVVVDVVALEPREVATPHLELLGYRNPRGRAMSAGSRPDELACDRLVFEVANLDALVERIERTGVAVIRSGSLSTRNESPDGSRAALVRDPDGHLMMLCEARHE